MALSGPEKKELKALKAKKKGGQVLEKAEKKRYKHLKSLKQQAAGAAAPAEAAAGEVSSSDGKKAKKSKKRDRGASDSDGGAGEPSPAKQAKGSSSSTATTATATTTAAVTGASDDDAAYRLKLGITTGKADEGAVAAPLPPCIRRFADAPFDAQVVTAMESAGFKEPTAIQAQGWPVALSGQDMIAVAKTGSGKTLAFLLPVFSRLQQEQQQSQSQSRSGPGALVLAPTRELALQIQVECERFGACAGIRSACLYGGAPAHEQKAALKRGADIVVATPGRLVDLYEQRTTGLDLGACTYVVMDEADRMLDMGFEPQIKKIFAALPAAAARQTLMFSATFPKGIRRLAAAFLRSPAETSTLFVESGEDAELKANTAVTQRIVKAQDDEKDAKLMEVLNALAADAKIICFANTKRRVEYLSKSLWGEGWGTVAIHGDKKQAEREAGLKKFVKGELPLMVATDVAARGLDIKGVTTVINFDMARDVESYVHRIGRTGRAGLTGESITFWNPDYDKECAPALCKIARDAGQEVPAFLAKFEKVKVSKANKAWAPTLIPKVLEETTA
eukprot:g2842.t1